MKNKIISIQSKVVYGYVGSNIAEFAIQLHGIDIISFPTVLLSTHTGHQPVYGKPISKDLFDELTLGIEALGIIPETSCIISGYIGTPDILASSSLFIQKIKTSFPEKLYICDPVMGDTEGLYVNETVASQIIHQLIPFCDVLTPNHFELEYILNCPILSIKNIEEQISKHSVLSKKTVIATSCHLEDTPKDKIETIIIKDGKSKRILTEKINLETTGTGDLFSALLGSQLTIENSIENAVIYASETISKIMKYMHKKGLKEINADCIVQYIK